MKSKNKWFVIIILFTVLSFIIVPFLLPEYENTENLGEPIPKTYIPAELPLGGAARLLAHDKNYEIYLEEDLTCISEHISQDKPIVKWVDKHLKRVRGHYLNARVSANKDSEDNIYCVLNPYEEIMVIGKCGDWSLIEYDNEILYVMSEYITDIEPLYSYDGTKLSSSRGRIQGPNGSETYYNLDMSGIVSRLKNRGYKGEYWIREDGCKMFGDYIMVAANFDLHPYGSLVQTSLGLGIVCDTGGFVEWNPTGLDLATNW